MLRAKQLSNFSNTARSIFYNGSRCSVGDGSSCSCADDEKCVSRRQNTLVRLNPSAAVPSPVARVESIVSKDAGNASRKPENVNGPTSRPQVVSPSSTLGKPDSVCYSTSIISDQTDVMNSSAPIKDHLVKVGIAAVGLFSDIVNQKTPLKDGSETVFSVQNYMVGRRRTRASIKPSTVITVQKDDFYDVHEKPSSSKGTAPSPSVKYQGPKGKPDCRKPAETFSYETSDKVGGSVGSQSIASDKKSYTGPQGFSSEKKSSNQKPKVYTNSSNVQASKTKFTGRVPQYINHYARDSKPHVGAAPFGRQYMSTGQVVESVLKIMGRLKWGPEAEAALENLNFSMDAYQANQVLKQIPDYVAALGFFYWLKRRVGFKHDGHTYTTMVGILGRAKQFDAINVLLDQMADDGYEPNVVTYNRLIHSYGRANYLNDALGVFHQMQEAGCKPDRVTYCTLIDIHAKAGFLDFALNMYQKMQVAGLSPDTFTYSVMINCLGKAGHLVAAHKLFREMVDLGCIPNLVTYNIMIALQAKTRNYPVALQYYRDMKNAGYEPDKVTYSIVMEVLGHCGYLEEAEAIFFEMKSKNWVPDEPVYGLLVDLWGKAGNAEKALQWYQAMLQAGLYPNVPTCNSLLSAFLRVHRLSDAYNLVSGMVSMGLNPSLQTYTLLLSCCTEAKSSFDMGFCGQLMAITGHPAHVFLLTMPASGPDGQNVRDHMGKFLDLMHSEDRESKRGLIDAVVDFLHKSGLKEEAGSVWEVAAMKNVYPDAVKEKSSCCWLINLHVMSDGTAVTALSRTLAWFRRQLLLSGNGPTRIDIVTGWGRRSRVTGASLVRQAVQELLDIFSFPFFTENGNSGCFVGCGESLNRWLQHPCVERMHLL
ncbi:pentatricopeptide repeat-containing protein At1g18900-like [Amaranthus tricolor]|uniref:pentatricopeptide repeat-containing protein At1g18900-like n=1 Tax=Amaranthus tricolor TaxID=29722 RepID=UPI00258980F6|nr:pentatricopeptide repeat-containing protein At1g18900-like [Amaranthus tricolor]XP_057519822.1 pentatricopeptide repeat-containing protein At1g18900-like [Amaranthus tricolor]